MKQFKLGKFLICVNVANGKSLREKHYAEYSQHLELGGIYTEKYFSFEKRVYLTDNTTVYWLFIWCFLIGIGKLNVVKGCVHEQY